MLRNSLRLLAKMSMSGQQFRFEILNEISCNLPVTFFTLPGMYI